MEEYTYCTTAYYKLLPTEEVTAEYAKTASHCQISALQNIRPTSATNLALDPMSTLPMRQS